MDRYLVISSDGHAGLPPEKYREYLEPKYRSDFDDVVEREVRAAVLALRVALVFAVNGRVGERSVGRGDTGAGNRLQDRKPHDPSQDGDNSQNTRSQQDPPTQHNSNVSQSRIG